MIQDSVSKDLTSGASTNSSVVGNLELRARGTIQNYSLTGVAVDTDQRLVLGESYRLVCEQPSIDASATIVWCRFLPPTATDDSAPFSYRAGLQLTNPLDPIRRADDEGNRSHDRRPWPFDSTVSLALRAPFRVLSLLADGLRIETTVLPDDDTMLSLELPANGEILYLVSTVLSIEKIVQHKPARAIVAVRFEGIGDRELALISRLVGEDQNALSSSEKG